MSLLPKIKRCPCCRTMNFITTNGVKYENTFKSYASWELKKKINCKKCKQELGLFVNKNEEKILWLDYLRCDDVWHDQLNKLLVQKNKKKNLNTITKEIQNIQNQIRESKVKLKIKLKIVNKKIFARHEYWSPFFHVSVSC